MQIAKLSYMMAKLSKMTPRKSRQLRVSRALE